MNILAAPNSMKGSLNAFDFADAIEAGFKAVSEDFSVRKIPLADGGDFTGEVIKTAFGADDISVETTGPLGAKNLSVYYVSGDIAVIEMANASGMKLVDPKDLNPMKASSSGTGELISDALKRGCKRLILCIGGSATVDGGSGMLEALGFRYTDQQGLPVKGNGEGLLKIRRISVPENLNQAVEITILCDVDNPLLGSVGAASVFGPQKGATAEMVGLLEEGLANWAGLLQSMTGIDVRNIPGIGAAGGMASGLVVFLNAGMVKGADYLLDLLHFDEAIGWADLVVTGEGKTDRQSMLNKAPVALAIRAHRFGKPVIALSGSNELFLDSPFDGIFSVTTGPMTLDDAMRNSFDLVRKEAGQIAFLLKGLKKFNNTISENRI